MREKKPVEPKEYVLVNELDNYPEDFGEMSALVDLLKEKYVVFSFYKKDGTYRLAAGTRQPEKLEELDAPIPVGARPATSLPFYDIPNAHWKSITYNRLNRPRVKILDTFDDLDDLMKEYSELFNFDNTL